MLVDTDYNRRMPTQQSIPPIYLSISVVLYRNDSGQLLQFRDALAQSVGRLRQKRAVGKISLSIVDNGFAEDGDRHSRLFTAVPGFDAVRFIQAESNLGYGRAHNRCLQQDCDFHLFLNPDVYLKEDALVAGMDYLQAHPHVGMVTPYAENAGGKPLFLSKRYPSVLDFVLRGFAPGFIRKLFAGRLARYEMQVEYLSGQPCEHVEIASGCCMLVRSDLLQKLRGFSEDYFLYFEDFDLSVRMRQFASIAYVPQMKIIHDGGHAARKGWWHVRQFGASGFRFFKTHGWR
ncbi:MAG TPA: glycosyltransferase family 2 protein [Pseudomonadales bacterium]|nr:glycosyltransferase family 2 protein [Pseudomonadales bacterium]